MNNPGFLGAIHGQPYTERIDSSGTILILSMSTRFEISARAGKTIVNQDNLNGLRNKTNFYLLTSDHLRHLFAIINFT